MKHVRVCLGFSMALGSLLVLSVSSLQAQETSPAQVPVLDTHKLMELLFEEPQKQLQELMASEPAERRTWNKIRDAVSTLAELSNLIMLRDQLDYEKTDEWDQMAAKSRDATLAVLEPVKANDYATAKEKYLAMIESCNACHTRFEPEVAPKLEPYKVEQ